MKRCVYCEGNKDGDTKIINIGRLKFGTCEPLYCGMYIRDIYRNVLRFESNVFGFKDMKINYCFMCGRKLEDK